MSLSVCLIAKNEEKWIGECLDHLKILKPELIVVDTGSTDRSMQIAREKGARVSSVEWENDFAKARNVSLDKATGEWVLVIDPDERIAEQDLLRLPELMKAPAPMAYSFQTRNYCENELASGFKPCRGEYAALEKGYPGYFESSKARLFQNLPHIRFVGSVHELIESTVDGEIRPCEIPIHHFGSTKEVKVAKKKDQLYKMHAEKKIQEEPESWKAHFEMGVEFLGASEYKKAAEALAKARKFKPDEPLVMSNLGYAWMEAGKLDQAEEVLQACLERDPQNHDAWLNLGVTAMRRKQYAEALQLFDRLVRLHPQSFMAFRNSGNCFARLQKFQEAAACLERALKIFPDFHEARVDLGVVCYAAGRADLAESILTEALQKYPGSVRAQAILDEIHQQKSSKA